jgi:hypothetical protein
MNAESAVADVTNIKKSRTKIIDEATLIDCVRTAIEKHHPTLFSDSYNEFIRGISRLPDMTQRHFKAIGLQNVLYATLEDGTKINTDKIFHTIFHIQRNGLYTKAHAQQDTISTTYCEEHTPRIIPERDAYNTPIEIPLRVFPEPYAYIDPIVIPQAITTSQASMMPQAITTSQASMMPQAITPDPNAYTKPIRIRRAYGSQTEKTPIEEPTQPTSLVANTVADTLEVRINTHSYESHAYNSPIIIPQANGTKKHIAPKPGKFYTPDDRITQLIGTAPPGIHNALELLNTKMKEEKYSATIRLECVIYFQQKTMPNLSAHNYQAQIQSLLKELQTFRHSKDPMRMIRIMKHL